MRAAPLTAGEHVAAARQALEAALLALSALPAGVEMAPIAAAFSAAFLALDELVQSDGGAVASRLRRALDLLEEARAEVAVADVGPVARGVAAQVDGIRAALEAARERLLAEPLPRALPEAAPPRPAFSRGTPALHAFERDPLAPRLRRSPPPRAPLATTVSSPPRSLVEARELAERLARDDEAPPESAPEPLRRGAESADEAHLMRLARGALEEIGALSLLLFPRGEERWTRGIPRFEDRILAALDFVIALGEPYVPSSREPAAHRSRFDVLGFLLDHTDDEPAPDPARAFTRALVLGCVEGDDTVRAAVLALRRSHPSTLAAQGHALTLASSPAVDAALARLVASEDPALASLALDTLAERRTATAEIAAPALAHADPRVRAAVARALAVSPERGRAVEALAERARREEDDRAFIAAVEGLALLGAPSGLEVARARLARAAGLADDTRAALVRLIALAGAADDAALLLRSLGRSPAETEALGWHGHPALVEPLLGALAARDAAIRTAAARALHRITGLSPASREERDAYDPETSAAAWAERIEDRRASLSPDRRHRFGQPYAPVASLDELSREDVPAFVRERCAFEVNALARGALWVRVDDWAARQRSAIEAARPLLGGAPAGLWMPELRASR